MRISKPPLRTRMNILYIHNTSLDSAKANLIQVIQMCHAFSNNGAKTVLALPSIKSKDQQIDYRRIINERFGFEVNFDIVTYPKITIFGKLKIVGGYFGVKKLLQNMKTDICFLRNVPFINLALKSGLPVVFESHEVILHNRSKILDHLWKRHLQKKASHEKFLKFITISESLALYWGKNSIPPFKIFTCHDGFNHRQYIDIPEKTATRREIGLPTDRKIVMYVGSLYRDRGIEDIIKLANIFHDVLFVIVGGPDKEKEDLVAFTQKTGISNILFKGIIPHNQVPKFLFAADILLMIWTKRVKTINYCSPLKLFEYMASGRIIVGHAFPTIKEILKDGENSLLAEPENFNHLKEKLRSALENNINEQLAMNARNLAFTKYTWDSRAKAILEQLWT